jgi:hypothetical protein
MQINTKYNVREPVHFYPMNNHKNKLREAIVKRIYCSISKNNSVAIMYTVITEEDVMWDVCENSIMEDRP